MTWRCSGWIRVIVADSLGYWMKCNSCIVRSVIGLLQLYGLFAAPTWYDHLHRQVLVAGEGMLFGDVEEPGREIFSVFIIY